MPIYEAQCGQCQKKEDYYQTMDNCQTTPWCCGSPMVKVITTASMVQGDLPSYTSPINGKWIDGRRQRKEDLKRNGCRPWEGLEQEKKESARQEKYAEAKLDASLTKSASEALSQLPKSKRDILKGI